MSQLIPGFVLAASIATLSACAPLPETAGTAPGTQRACFSPDQILNFRQPDSRSIYIRARSADVFEIAATGFCPDLDTANSLRISSMGGISSRLCTGDAALVTTSASLNPGTPCHARVERRLTAEEIAALPDRDRP